MSFTALLNAACNGHLEVVKRLLIAGANIHDTNNVRLLLLLLLSLLLK
jgi:ankyrin repeat protein